jgi:hypothetical protein
MGWALRGKAVEEPLEVLVQHRVTLHPAGELVELARARQRPVDQQVAHLEEGAALGQLLDRVPAVSQDAGVAVDVRDLRLAGRGVDEPGVQGDLAGRGQELADVQAVRAVRGRHHGQRQRLALTGDLVRLRGVGHRCS